MSYVWGDGTILCLDYNYFKTKFRKLVFVGKSVNHLKTAYYEVIKINIFLSLI